MWLAYMLSIYKAYMLIPNAGSNLLLYIDALNKNQELVITENLKFCTFVWNWISIRFIKRWFHDQCSLITEILIQYVTLFPDLKHIHEKLSSQ